MKVFIDTNVLIDFMAMRQSFFQPAAGCDCILTRNTKDFSKSKLSVMTSEEFLDKYFV